MNIIYPHTFRCPSSRARTSRSRSQSRSASRCQGRVALRCQTKFLEKRCQESRTNSLSLSLSGAERVVPVRAKGELPLGASAEANQGFVLNFFYFHIFISFHIPMKVAKQVCSGGGSHRSGGGYGGYHG